MKRHHAAGELPVSAPARDGGLPVGKGKEAGEEEEEADSKLGKFHRAQRRCSRLFLLVAVAATVTLLARRSSDVDLAGGGAGAAPVRIEAVPGPPPTVPSARRIAPIDRGEPSVSGHSSSGPNGGGGERVKAGNGGGEALSKTSTSVAADAGDKSSSSKASTSVAADAGDKSSSSKSSTSVAADAGDESSSTGSSTAKSASDDTGGKASSKDSSPASQESARTPAMVDGMGRDLCGGRYIYVQELPPRFNADMVQSCDKLSPWTDMCRYTANGGFGPLLRGGGGGDGPGWYDTDQHALDIIFHDRIKRYECLTDDPSRADAVFVPFYAGLDVARHLWGATVSERDALALEAADLLTARPEWRAMGGRDHFFVAGRTTWDFRRQADGDADWGSKLFRIPAVRNMTALVVEASPWHLNDAAVPYPTAFHPARDEDVFVYQDRLRGLRRPNLFSFAGAARPDHANSIDGSLVEQCRASPACSLMECGKGPGDKCESTAGVMKLFRSSKFCLVPRGSKSTSRLAFDAIVAGCIPVFFHPGTAYVQYVWHLPKNHAEYSVYIPEEDVRKNASVEERLRRIPPETVERMRDTVVGLIPAVTYSDASSRLETTMSDAFDLAVAAVIDKVAKLKKGIAEGRAEEKVEMYSWKYPLLGEGQKAEDPHEWDSLFAFN
ncbi:hypothetical protein ACP70R_021318 [Stipagrostis hirtigluma subsp. patula]